MLRHAKNEECPSDKNAKYNIGIEHIDTYFALRASVLSLGHTQASFEVRWRGLPDLSPCLLWRAATAAEVAAGLTPPMEDALTVLFPSTPPGPVTAMPTKQVSPTGLVAALLAPRFVDPRHEPAERLLVL
jgi:hypothetical protein